MVGADEIVATQMVVVDGKYTGEIARYVYGPEKAQAIRDLAAARGYDLDDCYGYSDSYTDVPMLESVGHPTAVNADRALRKVALNVAGRCSRSATRSRCASASPAFARPGPRRRCPSPARRRRRRPHVVRDATPRRTHPGTVGRDHLDPELIELHGLQVLCRARFGASNDYHGRGSSMAVQPPASLSRHGPPGTTRRTHHAKGESTRTLQRPRTT